MLSKFFKKIYGSISSTEDTVGFGFQVAAISITCTVIMYLLYICTIQPTPIEERFFIKPLTPDLLAERGHILTTVQAGMSLKHIRQFDFISNNFVIECTVWFEFDPTFISSDAISNFKFEKCQIIEKKVIKSHFVGKRMFVAYDIVLEFKNDIDYRLFPMDDHIVSLVLINNDLSPYMVLFESDKQKIHH